MKKEEWLEDFGDNLEYIMREKNVTQRELADKSGLSESTVSAYIHERKKMPGTVAIINMAYALRCSVEDLIDIGVGRIE